MITCSNAPQHEETEAQRSDGMLKHEQLALEFKVFLPPLRNVRQHSEPHATAPMKECRNWDDRLVTDETFQFRGVDRHRGDGCAKQGPSIVWFSWCHLSKK